MKKSTWILHVGILDVYGSAVGLCEWFFLHVTLKVSLQLEIFKSPTCEPSLKKRVMRATKRRWGWFPLENECAMYDWTISERIRSNIVTLEIWIRFAATVVVGLCFFSIGNSKRTRLENIACAAIMVELIKLPRMPVPPALTLIQSIFNPQHANCKLFELNSRPAHVQQLFITSLDEQSMSLYDFKGPPYFKNKWKDLQKYKCNPFLWTPKTRLKHRNSMPRKMPFSKSDIRDLIASRVEVIRRLKEQIQEIGKVNAPFLWIDTVLETTRQERATWAAQIFNKKHLL